MLNRCAFIGASVRWWCPAGLLAVRSCRGAVLYIMVDLLSSGAASRHLQPR
ncbi:hypothetical protein LP417_26630 [Polaromonas sp. P1-6]|nr:hypothetical protein LP417_26630 [Polaromonas sp. P1-6]